MTKKDDVSEQHDDVVVNDDTSSLTDQYAERRFDDKNRKKMDRNGDNRKIDPKRIKSEKRKGRSRDHSFSERN